MITVLKILFPPNKETSPFAIAYNKKCSFCELINIHENKELIKQIFQNKQQDCYCKCEVMDDKIVKVLAHVSKIEYLKEDN